MKRLYLILGVLVISIAFYFVSAKFFPDVLFAPPSYHEATASSGCADSDGGRDYYNKGILTLQDSDGGGTNAPEDSNLLEVMLSPGSSSIEDTCIDSKNVKEYYCDSAISYTTQNKFCPNGCENGACVQGKEPYCSHIRTSQEGWYQYGNLIQLAQCDGDYSQCKTPGFSGQIYGGLL